MTSTISRNNNQFDVPISEKSLLLASSNNNNKISSTPTTKGSSSINNDKEDDTGDENKKRKSLRSTTVVLSFCLLIQSYLLVSVFPYSGFLAMHLIPNLNEETAGSYAGLIASSFMIGRTFSSFEWGKAADRYGRVFVIKTSLFLSAIFSIFFGLAPTFCTALLLRCLLGLSNGLIGPIKTMVSEYARGDKNKETQMMAIVMGMWGYGFLINPAISGYLSDPIKQYPNVEFGYALEHILEIYPFLLPNVLGSILCILGYFLVDNYVEETLPEEKRQQFCFNDILPLMIDDDDEEEEKPATILSLLARYETRQHLLVYWIYSFLIITVDEIFPLYCISKTSGLGITEKVIGNIMSGTGLFYIIVQYFILTRLVDRFGLYSALRTGTFLSIPLACLIPVSLITNRYVLEGTLNLLTIIYLSFVYAMIRAFSSVVFSVITMTTNGTVPAHHRGTMNGLSMLGGSLAKSCGPLFGGLLFSNSVSRITPPFGSVFVYCVISALGICLGILTLFLKEYDQHHKNEEISKAKKDHDKELGEKPLTF
ncbi:MFS general substrate transporter [Fragilariopsis cylindrus CCMP1102]|uniref:MFS general substrate transporter n=1 Tax=Fragilariopsis cylindrus CCMP1102 TaxID=635003 RepID=A0A1E7FGI9_9STRA|nr:MFS general substrate transporter [Fragilariopsis cylindrus CCMP1102]|eukprot:OEU17289.1 MFS general substrate transporter [Fragilariopsis cylindrus CCMP1102]